MKINTNAPKITRLRNLTQSSAQKLTKEIPKRPRTGDPRLKKTNESLDR